MKRLFILFSLLVAVGAVTPVAAAPRSAAEAAAVAKTFFSATLGRHAAALERAAVAAPALRKTAARDGDDDAAASYYIYNDVEAEGGFVIVSGSDRLRPVLGYSATGTFVEETLPDNLRWWMSYLAEAAAYVEEHPEAAVGTITRAAAERESIAPLLGKIQWGQTAPFNALCPSNSPTGCVATAMAQVIYYHRYPERGIGSNSYTWNGVTHDVDFSTHTYDYANMFDRYSAAVTREQIQEVAQLNYDCGVAINMMYEETASGAYAPDYVPAFVNHFGYNDYTSLQLRSCYDFDDWNALLYGELAAARPIPFAATSSVGGHAFVLDGYDGQGYYHVNWGWEGMADGYYDVCVLNPTETGTGAYMSPDGFCHEQYAVVQLATEHTGRYLPPLFAENILAASAATVNVGNALNFSVTNVYNYSAEPASGKYGAVIMQGDSLIARNEYGVISIEGATNGFLSYYARMFNRVQVPATIADGTYQVYAYYQPGDDYGLIRCTATGPSYLTLNVAEGKAWLTKDKKTIDLETHNWSTQDSTVNIHTGLPSTITVDVTNRDTETFVGKFYVLLRHSSGYQTQIEGTPVLTLAAEETKRVSFAYTFTMSGEWTITLCVERQNVNTIINELTATAHTFHVVADATSMAAFTLTKAPWVAAGTSELGTNITFALALTNAGGDYDGVFRIQFFKTKTSTTPLLTLDTPGTFAAETSDTAYVTGMLEGLTPQTSYFASAYYYKGGDFTKLQTAIGVTNRVQVNVRAATGIEAVVRDAETATGETIAYDILGKRVGTVSRSDAAVGYGLPAGIYIIDRRKVVVP